MLDRVVETISRYNMLGRGRSLGVAVSGGVDSVCLLHILSRLAGTLDLRLKVLHLDHQLRSPDSAADARFVQELAESKGLPCVIERATLAGGNLEQAGREARLEFFRRQIENGFVRAVATAHTRDDQAETVLFRILRGSGVTGLAGIHPVTGDGLVRPLLSVSRREILDYAREYGLSWREDATNQDSRFSRNRLRQEWLPALTTAWNPNLAQALANLAEIVWTEEAHWNQTLEGWAAICTNEPILFHRHAFLALDHATQRRVIRLMMQTVSSSEIGLQHVDAAATLIKGPRGTGRVQFPGGEVERSFDWVRLCKLVSRPRERRRSAEIVPGIAVAWGTGCICLEVIAIEPGRRLESLYNEGSCLDADLASEPRTLRGWRSGDRLGGHKIKELFQEFRVPRWERNDWPVLAVRDQVVWARRFGVGPEFLPGGQTQKVLVVHDGPAHESKTVSSASLTNRSMVPVSSTECE